MNQWVDGFGDLPENLVRFALTLPWWQAAVHCALDDPDYQVTCFQCLELCKLDPILMAHDGL